jgi:hypothetical protein
MSDVALAFFAFIGMGCVLGLLFLLLSFWWYDGIDGSDW